MGTEPPTGPSTRTANVTGATSATVNFTLTDNGFDAGETLVAEYSIDGGAFVTIGTFDGATGYSGSTLPLTIALAGNTSLRLRFRAPQTWNAGGDQARVDDVDISFNVPANAVGSQIVRTANLTGALAPALTLTTTSVGLAAGDTVVLKPPPARPGPSRSWPSRPAT